MTGIWAVAVLQSAIVFTSSGDVGNVGRPGLIVRAGGTYRVTASGSNIWDREDSFYFAHKRVHGDVTITSGIHWATAGGHEHKKAGLMIRAGQGPTDPHASVMLHGDGLISLQYRKTRGGATGEVRLPVKAGTARLRIARHGDVVSVEVARPGEEFQPGGALTLPLPPELEAGVAACSHDNADSQTALFTDLALEELGTADAKNRVVESTLEVVHIETGERRIVYRAREHFEAPNWSRDGFLYYNGGGRIYRIPADGGAPVHIPTGDVRVNNDHGLSPDGQSMAISGSVAKGESRIYLLPVSGGTPQLVTQNSPSYWHGWSPDGQTLAYCANRNREFDIYTIPAGGGEEIRLTTAPGLDDGPDYSPDGRFIYFNSERSGVMRIWRMRPDGSGQELFSSGPESADWFPHPSPDGNWVVYLSYDPTVKGHPANKDVVLRIAPAGGGATRVLATLFGGQGTINVPSWSPDSSRLAFVSYRLVKGD
jgi:regulation of enolase protein 1 (concanavalin A-like superfamily)